MLINAKKCWTILNNIQQYISMPSDPWNMLLSTKGVNNQTPKRWCLEPPQSTGRQLKIRDYLSLQESNDSFRKNICILKKYMQSSKITFSRKFNHEQKISPCQSISLILLLLNILNFDFYCIPSILWPPWKIAYFSQETYSSMSVLMMHKAEAVHRVLQINFCFKN